MLQPCGRSQMFSAKHKPTGAAQASMPILDVFSVISFAILSHRWRAELQNGKDNIAASIF